MPLSENSRGITCIFEHLRDSHRGQCHSLALVNGVRHPAAELVPAGHQRGTRRGTGWTDMKVGEPNALRVKTIEVWRRDDRIPETREVAVTDVIGDHEDDVRSVRSAGDRRRVPPSTTEGQRAEEISRDLHALAGISP